MAKYRLYPAVGQVVLDEDGNVISSMGIGPVTITPYYDELMIEGMLTRRNPLETGAPPLLPPGAFTNYTVTPDQFLHLASFAARVNAAINVVNARGGGTVRVGCAAYSVTGVGTDSILLKSNVKLVFDPGCTISTGVITGHSYVISANTIGGSIENVHVEGNGLIITGDTSTAFIGYLIAVNIQNPGDVCRNIRFSDIELRDANLDGLSVGGNVGAFHDYVTFERVTSTGAKRCGGSAISGNKVRFFDCHFDENGAGQEPECGFDIEVDPAGNGQLVARDIVFEKTTFNGNVGAGLLITAPYYGNSARTLVYDCEMHDNGLEGCVSQQDDVVIARSRAFRNGTSGFYVTGGAQVSDCLSKDNELAGFLVPNSGKIIAVANCIAQSNGLDGFLLNSFAGSTGKTSLNACHAFGNLSRGINLNDAWNVTVTGGSCVLNRQEGIRLGGGHGNSVSMIVVEQNGIDADASAANLVLESGANGNAVVGVTARQSPNFLRSAVIEDAIYTTLTTAKLEAHASTLDDMYNGMYARIISGTRSGAGGFVTNYDAANKTITVAWDPGLAGLPDATSIITLVGGRLFSGTVQSATATSVVLSADLASARDSAYVGYLRAISGTGAGQIKAISGYVGATRTLTVGAFSPVLDSTSIVEVVATNRPLYGIRVTAACSLNLIRPNDCYYAGTSSGFSDLGSSNTTDANRVS